MKQVASVLFPAFVSSFFLPHEGFCQIIEEDTSASVIIEERPLTEDTGRAAATIAETHDCFPACRKGHVCHEGKCISKCNPPCPANMICQDNGECSPADTVPKIVRLKQEMRKISQFKQVSSPDEVMQGIIITTKCPDCKVQIEGKTYTFDNELNLIAPRGDYSFCVEAKNRSAKCHSAEVTTAGVEEIYSKLRPVRLNFGVTLGPAFIPRLPGLMLNLDAGVNIVAAHFAGLSASGFGGFGTNEYITYTDDYIYPDTIRHTYSDLYGIGITYGYSGLLIRGNVMVMPRISMGYWRQDDAVVYRGIDADGMTDDYYADMAEHTYTLYFARPGVEVRFGHRVFGFRMHIDTYIGESVLPPSMGFGIIVRIL
jgi:hypothetical protein